MALSATPVMRMYRTSIGKKVIMAVTGLVGVLFLIGHIFGNLHVFEGSEKFNEYGEFLRIVGAPIFGTSQLLWIIRAVLLACIVLHVVSAVQLYQQSRASRPIGYVARKDPRARISSLTMRIGGVIILAFIVIHLANLTWGWLHPNFIYGDVYHNVVTLFQLWPVTIFYVIAMIAVGLHLDHGTWSLFQTLGFRTARNNLLLRRGATALAVLFVIASSTVPLAILFRIVS